MKHTRSQPHGVTLAILILITGSFLLAFGPATSDGDSLGTRGNVPTAIIDSITPDPAVANDISLLDQSTFGYWSFDSTDAGGMDDSVLSNDGMVNDANITEGKSGNAFQGDGVDGYVELTQSLPDATNLTVAVWVYYTGDGDQSTIFMDATTNQHNDFVFNMNDTQIGIRSDKNGDELRYEDPPGLVQGLDLANAWNHIAWVMMPEQSLLYLNGELIFTVNETANNIGYHADHPSIGRWFDEGGNRKYFDGMIDEFGMWDRPLSKEEILAHKDGNLGSVVIFSGSGTDDGNITRYAWNSSIDGEFYNGSHSTLRYTGLSMGKHTISLRVMDDEGQWSAPVTTTLYIGVQPVALITGITPNIAIRGGSVWFNASATSDSSITNYEWRSYIDGIFYSGPNASISISTLSKGDHIITLRVQDEHGLWSGEATSSLTVKAEDEEDDDEDGGGKLVTAIIIFLVVIFLVMIIILTLFGFGPLDIDKILGKKKQDEPTSATKTEVLQKKDERSETNESIPPDDTRKETEDSSPAEADPEKIDI